MDEVLADLMRRDWQIPSVDEQPVPIVIGVVVPAHDEEGRIDACLRSIKRAALHPGLDGEEVIIVVALDSCTDRTGLKADRNGARTVSIDARNVGAARAAGCKAALGAGARWLAFTDADSTVAPDWLVAQLSLATDVVCGTVSVDDWTSFDAITRREYEARYADADGHRHIHGANLAVSASAYLRVGGFQSFETGEDVALVESLFRDGATIAWSAIPRVATSARRASRAPRGFGAFLQHLEAEVRLRPLAAQ